MIDSSPPGDPPNERYAPEKNRERTERRRRAARDHGHGPRGTNDRTPGNGRGTGNRDRADNRHQRRHANRNHAERNPDRPHPHPRRTDTNRRTGDRQPRNPEKHHRTKTNQHHTEHRESTAHLHRETRTTRQPPKAAHETREDTTGGVKEERTGDGTPSRTVVSLYTGGYNGLPCVCCIDPICEALRVVGGYR